MANQKRDLTEFVISVAGAFVLRKYQIPVLLLFVKPAQQHPIAAKFVRGELFGFSLEVF